MIKSLRESLENVDIPIAWFFIALAYVVASVFWLSHLENQINILREDLTGFEKTGTPTATSALTLATSNSARLSTMEGWIPQIGINSNRLTAIEQQQKEQDRRLDLLEGRPAK